MEAIETFDHAGCVIEIHYDECPMSPARIQELCGSAARRFHAREWVENALRSELRTWGDYFEGSVYGYIVRDPATDTVIDSCWGYYGDDFEPLRADARDTAEAERTRAANLDTATAS